MELRHGPNSYGRQQWGILHNGGNPDAATPREGRRFSDCKPLSLVKKYQTRAMREAGTLSWWPDEWVCSFKRQCIPPFPFNKFVTPRFRKGSRIVAFHGKPDIDEAIAGYHGCYDGRGKLRTTHTTCLPTPWLKRFWDV